MLLFSDVKLLRDAERNILLSFHHVLTADKISRIFSVHGRSTSFAGKCETFGFLA